MRGKLRGLVALPMLLAWMVGTTDRAAAICNVVPEAVGEFRGALGTGEPAVCDSRRLG